VLEGSLRQVGNRIRVTGRLIEAESGRYVWAERYDRDLADIFAVQDEITEAVTTSIAPAIADAELQRAMRKPPESLDARGAYQRGGFTGLALGPIPRAAGFRKPNPAATRKEFRATLLAL
jgi:adenylate cyclase